VRALAAVCGGGWEGPPVTVSRAAADPAAVPRVTRRRPDAPQRPAVRMSTGVHRRCRPPARGALWL